MKTTNGPSSCLTLAESEELRTLAEQIRSTVASYTASEALGESLRAARVEMDADIARIMGGDIAENVTHRELVSELTNAQAGKALNAAAISRADAARNASAGETVILVDRVGTVFKRVGSRLYDEGEALFERTLATLFSAEFLALDRTFNGVRRELMMNTSTLLEGCRLNEQGDSLQGAASVRQPLAVRAGNALEIIEKTLAAATNPEPAVASSAGGEA